MKRILGLAAAAGFLALVASAQDDPKQVKMQLERMVAGAKIVGMESGVMGPAVKDAPYSADETRESTLVLGDGTRIHNESKTTVYRDSQGRVRRETPDEISIWDPTTGINYVLNPKTMTARKMGMNFVIRRSISGDGKVEKGQMFTYSLKVDDAQAPVVTFSSDGKNAAEAKMKAAAEAKAAGRAAGGAVFATLPDKAERRDLKKESLGTQVMEGVTAEGSRVTSTIEQGAIGNDRPIQSISERWYSPDLQTDILTKRTDPRMGEETMKLTNIHRGEPSPVLFEVPPGFTVIGK